MRHLTLDEWLLVFVLVNIVITAVSIIYDMAVSLNPP